ncbi:MAG: carbonic anhydrase [Polyangiaceae bacterium]|nr:carbonic anhydrase [Polyangiaceae bacterium]MCW5788915.1 carbonic anhydrase [Polyangiaceae bacterium]
MASYMRRTEMSTSQEPFAVILGCADARVPAEIIFDQGLGDLFVIRVAGNIVASSQVGSVEFAVEAFGTKLVVVLGHTQCGAISATLQEILSDQEPRSKNLMSIVDRVRPSVEPLFSGPLAQDLPALKAEAVRANVRASTCQLRAGSPIIERLVADQGLLIVGAEYDLDSGRVDFFDGVPSGALTEPFSAHA